MQWLPPNCLPFELWSLEKEQALPALGSVSCEGKLKRLSFYSNCRQRNLFGCTHVYTECWIKTAQTIFYKKKTKKQNTIFLLFSRRQGYWKLVSSKASILMTNLSCSIYIWPQLIFSKCNNKWQKHFKKSNWLLKSTCFYSTLAPWFGFRAKHVDW